MGGTATNQTTELSADEIVSVRSVDAAGTADLTLTMDNWTVKTTAGGVTTTTALGDVPPSDLKVASDGRVISQDGEPAVGSNPFLAFTAMGGGFFVTAVLPDHAVTPGDRWSKTFDQAAPNGAGGGVHVQSDSQYVRDESLSGINAAVIETRSTATIDVNMQSPQMSMMVRGTETADVTTWIDPDGHRVLKTHSVTVDDGTMHFGGLGGLPSPLPDVNQPMSEHGSTTTDLLPA